MSGRNGLYRRRIAVVTGTRAEYGLLKSVMDAIRLDPHLELQLVVTGMHLLAKFGDTAREIERDGYPIAARIAMQSGDDSPIDQAIGLGSGVRAIAEFVDREKTDIVLVLGDRIEAFAGSLAGFAAGRLVAHVHGGDRATGDFDDSIRHAITKIAHLHLAATKDACRRLRRMGEDATRIKLVGAPGLDRLRELLATSRPEASSPTALVVQHAVGRPVEHERRVMTWILDGARTAGLRRVIVYPNSDRGHGGVISAIEGHVQKYPDECDVHRSLPRDAYLRALIGADLLLGNSSSGYIEAPLAGTATVNIGDRQSGRQKGGRSIVQASERPNVIRAAIRRAMGLRVRAGGRTPYGDGRAGERIARELARVSLSRDVLRKTITY